MSPLCWLVTANMILRLTDQAQIGKKLYPGLLSHQQGMCSDVRLPERDALTLVGHGMPGPTPASIIYSLLKDHCKTESNSLHGGVFIVQGPYVGRILLILCEDELAFARTIVPSV